MRMWQVQQGDSPLCPGSFLLFAVDSRCFSSDFVDSFYKVYFLYHVWSLKSVLKEQLAFSQFFDRYFLECQALVPTKRGKEWENKEETQMIMMMMVAITMITNFFQSFHIGYVPGAPLQHLARPLTVLPQPSYLACSELRDGHRSQLMVLTSFLSMDLALSVCLAL